MSNFPLNFDDDITLPVVNDNLTEIGGEAINAVRDATFNIEQYLGLGGNGSTNSISQRIGISLNPDGTIKPSAIASLGLVTLPIDNSQISNTAQILESKLKLDYKTSDLYNYIRELSSGINTSLNWISATGIKFEPHLLGFAFRHDLQQIDIGPDTSYYLKNKFDLFRDNQDGYTVVNDINNELLSHQSADGSLTITPTPVYTNNGSFYPATHAHISSGIYLNTTRFSTIPQELNDLQKFADYIDSASIFLLGTRIQNLYSNGISKESRSSNLTKDGYGQFVISSTPVITYLLNAGISSTPVDNIDNGDDIIEFKPAAAELSSNSFDSKFALVKIGDIVRVNYDGVEVSHIVKERKYVQASGIKKFIIRIEGRNYKYSTTATARIDKPLANSNKYGALSIAPANNTFSEKPSLIVTSPRGASVLGIGFNADLLDSSHYKLYLALYPTGKAEDGHTIMPGIDVTGNSGATPGKYTLSSVVDTVNNAFRKVGYNYRFVAFQHQGEFGIALADSYNNAAFSILSAVISNDGLPDETETNTKFPNNVVGIFGSTNSPLPQDPLGFGPGKSNFASPEYKSSYSSAAAALSPTKLFVPLRRNNFYVNGFEIEKFTIKNGQIRDVYGDGYWEATVFSKDSFPAPNGRVEVKYRVNQDLFDSGLCAGKTIVVQSAGTGSIINFGRFIIKNVEVSCDPIYTDITVYDAVHANGVSPGAIVNTNTKVAIYFSDDSVSFNEESATDRTPLINKFKRHFEVYVDQYGKTFTHERARFNATTSDLGVNDNVLRTNTEINKLNLVSVSSKIRGYQYGSLNKITLRITSYDSNNYFTGYLCSFDGTNYIKKGPVTSGKIGNVTRFYDESNIDYIDIIFDLGTEVSSFTNKVLDIQLFPSLALDNEIMLIGKCQLNDLTKKITNIKDERQFGNTSEKDLTTSALNYISAGDRLLHGNGVIRGFDLEEKSANPNKNQVYLTGGVALVNGKLIQSNSQTIVIPLIKEKLLSNLNNINWAVCISDAGEIVSIPLLNYDESLSTPNVIKRQFVAYNPVNGQEYDLYASSFSNIVNSRKDLTILYIAASVITGTGSSAQIELTISDCRKYSNDADTSLPLKLTDAASQGNFKNIESIFNWVKYNNNYNGSAIVRGATAETGEINNPLRFNFESEVTIDGQNNAILTMNGPVTIGSNIIFKNLTLIFNNSISLTTGASNVVFDNCDVTITNSLNASPPQNNIIFDFVNASRISIKDSSFNVQYNDLSTSGAVFRLNNVSDFLVSNCDMFVSFNYNDISGIPGDFFIVKNSPGLTIKDSSFAGNFTHFVRNTVSSYMTLENLNVTSTFNPAVGPSQYNSTTDPLGTLDILSDITYSGTSQVAVNRGRASFIYSKVGASGLRNILINNIRFIYSPQEVSSDRFSMINFDLSDKNSVLENCNITNCKFINNTTADDYKPAIAIINTASSTTNTNQQPIIKNLVINNNYCNRAQSIILTSRTSSSKMSLPGLVTQNCVISNNNCGTIGYWVSSIYKVDGNVENSNSFNNKSNSLTIENNNCHLITNVNDTATYFPLSKIVSGQTDNMSTYASGNVIISSNRCNWIHTGIYSSTASSIKIVDNYLSAYSNDYLSLYSDSSTISSSNGTPYSYGYAIFVSSNKIPSNDASCIISGNTTNKGYYFSGTTLQPYGYDAGYIYTLCSSNITNNTLKGVVADTVGGYLVATCGKNVIITNNKIYREDSDIGGYVGYVGATTPAPSDYDPYAVIVDNFFDSPYTSNAEASDINTGIVKTNWIVERNKNQSSIAIVPLTNNLYLKGQFGIDSSNLDYFVAPVQNYDGYQYKSHVLHVHDGYSVSNQGEPRYIGWQDDLTKYLPNGAKIVEIKMGLRTFDSNVYNGTAGTFNSKITLYLNKYNPSYFSSNLDYFTALPNGTLPNPVGVYDSNVLLDGAATYTPNLQFSANEINASSTTIMKSIDLKNINLFTGGPGSYDDTNSYIVTKSNPITLSLDIRFERSPVTTFTLSGPLTSRPPVNLYLSPILIKYRW